MMLTMVKGVPTSGFDCLEDKKAPKHQKFTSSCLSICRCLEDLEKQAGLKKDTLGIKKMEKREIKDSSSSLAIGWVWTIYYKPSLQPKKNSKNKHSISGYVLQPRVRCCSCKYIAAIEVSNNCTCSTSFLDGKCRECGREVKQ